MLTLERKLELLANVNRELSLQYGAKHQDVGLSDVEAVYFRNVLGVNADAKTRKGKSKGYLTGILYLAPAKQSGIEVCPGRSVGCTKACLFSAGRGRFYSVNKARILKTLAYHFDKDRFIVTIKKSINSLIVKAKNKDMIPVVRLNGTSDLLWERTDIMSTFPDVQFYDYTKIANRFSVLFPKNYHLTFSLSETGLSNYQALGVLSEGNNVAVVFDSDNYPETFLGHKVINGDTTDLRFLDTSKSVGGNGVVIGLKAKGQAKKDLSGFVQSTNKVA